MLSEINDLLQAAKSLQDSKKETERVREWASCAEAEARAGLEDAKRELEEAKESSKKFRRKLAQFELDAAPLRRRQEELLKKGASPSPDEFREFLDISEKLSEMLPRA